MKNNIILKALTALAVVPFMGSCEKEYVPVDTISDVAYFTSLSSSMKDEIKVNVGDFLSVMDASQGLLSHKWIIKEGSQFMIDDFDCESDEPFVNQVDPGKTLESDNLVESIYFGEAGLTSVRLYDTFAEKVQTHDAHAVEAVERDGAWLLDKTLSVDVYGIIKPEIKVLVNGEVKYTMKAGDAIDMNKLTPIEVTIGQEVEFLDVTTYDRPDSRVWNIPESAQGTSADESALFSFNALGDFSGFSVDVKRIAEPVASVTAMIPVKISVVPSKEDFKVKTADLMLSTVDLNTIVVTANGAFQPILSDISSNFTATIAKADGTDVPVSVNKVEVDPSNAGALIVSMSELVYPGELVTLAYDGKAEIMSTDNRELFAFEASSVLNTNEGENVLTNIRTTFEGTQTLQEMGWDTHQQLVNFNILVVTDRPDATDDNKRALLFDYNQAITVAPIYFQFKVGLNDEPIEKGNYTMQYSIYMVDDTNVGKFYIPWFSETGGPQFGQLGGQILWSADDVGKWVVKSMPIKVTTDGAHANIKMQLPPPQSVIGATKIYFDDFRIIKARP